MTESPDQTRVVWKFGILGFVTAIGGFLLSIWTYIVFFICGKSLHLIPKTLELRLAMLIMTAVVLIAAFLLEGVASLTEAQPRWQLMLGVSLWVLGAVFCTIMFTGISS